MPKAARTCREDTVEGVTLLTVEGYGMLNLMGFQEHGCDQVGSPSPCTSGLPSAATAPNLMAVAPWPPAAGSEHPAEELAVGETLLLRNSSD
jgi:hypothetical protein